MRIVSVLDTWEGSNSYAFLRALRRLGHSVVNVDPSTFAPSGWSGRPLRGVRRALEPPIVRQLTDRIVTECRALEPDMLFVYKGRYVTRQAVDGARATGAIALNYYPDVSFLAHGRYLPAALPTYDWIFTTKSFGVADMERVLGVRHAEFLPHGFDPEVHAPIEVDHIDRHRYACEVSFIGTWSPKKQQLLESLVRALPDITLRIWGAQWGNAAKTLERWTEGRGVLGREYAKAIVCSDINLGLLSESRKGASSGDLITSRTFHIPATASFMLHERTPELLASFVESAECAAFEGSEELIEQVRRYRSLSAERTTIGARARERCLRSGYSIEERAMVVLRRAEELRGVRATRA